MRVSMKKFMVVYKQLLCFRQYIFLHKELTQQSVSHCEIKFLKYTHMKITKKLSYMKMTEDKQC